MERLQQRDHTIMGAIMVYLHAQTEDAAERAAVLNHAIDAVFNLAMMVCEEGEREVVQAELAKRILSMSTRAYPKRDEMISQGALNGLFRAGLANMSNDETLMNLLGAMLLAKAKPAVNDVMH
jgi:DNA-directed RNA polymerase subunit L